MPCLTEPRFVRRRVSGAIVTLNASGFACVSAPGAAIVEVAEVDVAGHVDS